MKILLISANTETMNMPVLPLGLASIARAAQDAGHSVKVINLMGDDDALKTIEEALDTFDPHAIGISVRNIDDQVMDPPHFLLEPVRDIIAFCKTRSRAPIVIGGAGYSIFPQAALDYLGADMGIQGEGENSFVAALKRIENKAPLSDVPGLYLPEKGLQRPIDVHAKIDPQRPPLPGVHMTIPATFSGQPFYIPFQTRRGCPMNCSYCSTGSIEGTILRKRSIPDVVETLALYKKAGFDHFFFVDNTFNFPYSYATALCDAIIAKKLSIFWRCILYPWKIDDALVEKLAAAGCTDVSLGFESGSIETLKQLNKKYTLDDVRRISAMLKKHGVKQIGFLLLGGVGETRDTAMESLEFADSLDLDTMQITVGIRIYPNTPLARQAVEQGGIEATDDLLMPKFYIQKGLKDWLHETTAAWVAARLSWDG